LTFLDADGKDLQTLTFGTPEANAVEGQGWYGNENSEIGSFQWAGKEAKRAELLLTFPEEAEAVMLSLSSLRSGIEMKVSVDGVNTASIRPGAFWHKEYIPLREAVPDYTELKEPAWIEGQSFPTFPSTDRVYVLFVPNALKDWWGAPSRESWRISDSMDTMNALTLVGMQGVINRYIPSVYISWDDAPFFNDENGVSKSEFWLPELEKDIEVIRVPLTGPDAVNFLYQRYNKLFNGTVIYDPQVPDTINLATMYAGLENRIIIAPQQTATPGIPSHLQAKDLRTLVAENQWDASSAGNYKLYKWVYDNLWPSLEHRILGMASPGPPTSEKIRPSETYSPLTMACRDYLVALRLPCIWLSPVTQPHADLFSRFLSDCPPVTPVFGFYGCDEEATVALASKHGCWVPVIMINNAPLSSGSLSVFSGVNNSPVKYQSNIDVDHLFATLGNPPILTLWNSDGDNIQYQMDRGFGPDFLFEKVQGQKFGWQTNPVLVDLAPPVWNYYVNSREEISLVSCLSGAGYAYPTLMSRDQLTAYVDFTGRYLEKSGLRVIQIDNRFGYVEPLISTYNQGLKDTGYLGAIDSLAGFPWGTSFYYSGGPAPVIYPSYVVKSINMEGVMANLFQRKPGEVLVTLAGPCPWYWDNVEQSSYLWHKGREVADPDTKSGRALLFSPSTPQDRGTVVWGPFASLAQGDYTVTYRLKVPDNTSSKPVARIYVCTVESGVRDYASRVISPNEFTAAGKYQNFTVSFSLDKCTNKVEFCIEYTGGYGDENMANINLSADIIMAEKVGGLDLPVIGSCFLTLMSDTRLSTSRTFTDQFEAQGGLVLHPDECMAAFNPEYMLGFATPILGNSNPELIEAKRLLDAGDYLGSLLATRQALRTLPDRSYGVQVSNAGRSFQTQVSGKTYVTNLIYDPSSYKIRFNTHGPPQATTQASVTLPSDIPVGRVKVSVDGEALKFTSTSSAPGTVLSLTLPSGGHSVEVELPFNEAPTSKFTYTRSGSTVADEVQFTDESTDADGMILSWSWSFGDGATSQAQNPTHRYSAKGSFTASLTVLDDDGAENVYSTQIDVANTPPQARFTYSPQSPTMRDTVQFMDASSDIDGQVTSLRWSFGDGGSSTQRNPSHTYSTKGSYTVILRVEDESGAASERQATLRVVNLAPTAAFSSTLVTPLMGQEISFRDESSDPESRLTRVEWDFGDGSTTTQSNPSHSYTRGGEYIVKLTAWDDEGASASATKAIVVTPTFTVLVRVQDLFGLPVSGAGVQVKANNQRVAEGQTDNTGVFSVRGLVSGLIDVQASSMGVTSTVSANISQDTDLLVRVNLSTGVLAAVGVVIALALILFLTRIRRPTPPQ
jgi:PKD repeat protein